MGRDLGFNCLQDIVRGVDDILAAQPGCAYEIRLVHGNDDQLRGDRQPAGLLTRRALRWLVGVTRLNEVVTNIYGALRRY
jgi:hypothetical protein